MSAVARGVYMPGEGDNAYSARTDYDYWVRHHLLMEVTAWTSDDSPIATARQFSDFMAGNAANDKNGNWGRVWEVQTTDAGQVMVLLSGDAVAITENAMRHYDPEDDPESPAPCLPHDGMTLAEFTDRYDEVDVWHANEGNTYRLADATGWDDWAPVEAPA